MLKIRLTEENVSSVADILFDILSCKGGVALVPTETVYGLIARADDLEAQERIFKLKHRLAGKRFGWFVHDWRILKNYGVVLDGLPERLAAEYCPGALTIIAPCENGTTQGFRVPDVPLLLELLNKTASPLLQTSANASGMPDARSCNEALVQLDGEVDCAVDGGTIPVSAMASTVVDAVGEKIKILRQGGLDLQKWL